MCVFYVDCKNCAAYNRIAARGRMVRSAARTAQKAAFARRAACAISAFVRAADAGNLCACVRRAVRVFAERCAALPDRPSDRRAACRGVFRNRGVEAHRQLPAVFRTGAADCPARDRLFALLLPRRKCKGARDRRGALCHALLSCSGGLHAVQQRGAGTRQRRCAVRAGGRLTASACGRCARSPLSRPAQSGQTGRRRSARSAVRQGSARCCPLCR